MGLLYLLKRIVIELIILVAALFFLPIFVAGPILFIPFILYRLIVSFLGKLFIPNVVGIMNCRNSSVAHDDLWGEPKQNIVVSICFNEPLDFNQVFSAWEALLETRDEESGELEFPEFKRFYDTWGGHMFYREDPHFDMKNHVKRYREEDKNGESPPVSYEEMKEFVLDLVKRPFVWGKSPWELIQVDNLMHPDIDICKGESGSGTSMLILRIHHGLCDGTSILQAFTTAVAQWQKTKEKMATPVYSLGATGEIRIRFWTYIIMWITAPYFIVRQGIDSCDFNGFRRRKINGTFQTSGITMRVDEVKEIRKKWGGVTFSSVVLSAVAGGFHKYMKKYGMRIPDSFHLGMPFPWPGRHKYKLQNNMSFCIIGIPVGLKDVEKRVRVTNERWLRMKRSTLPLMNWSMMPVIGVLPGWLVTKVVNNDITTMVFSNFPGPPEKINVFGRTTEDINFVGLWRGSCGIGLAMISSHDNIKLTLGVDTAIVTSQELVDEIMALIRHEFTLLANHKFSTQLDYKSVV